MNFDIHFRCHRNAERATVDVAVHPIATADRETIDHLPLGFAEGLSTPVIVSSGSEPAAHLYGAD